MKTITEFFGPSLKIAAQKLEELVAAGKTPEEIPAAMGEAFKLEGDKLKHFLNALETVKAQKGKREAVKRVIVFEVGENEKAPSGAVKAEEHYFLIEAFPSAHRPEPPRHDERGGPGRGKGKGKGKGGRGPGRGREGGGRDGGGRGPRRDAERGPARDAAGPKPVITPKTPIAPKPPQS